MSADDGYAYFVKKTAAFAVAQGRRPVQWSEVYDHFKNALPKQARAPSFVGCHSARESACQL